MFPKPEIPLSKQPAYQTAIGQVVEIGRALTATTTQLEHSRSSLLERQNRKIAAPSLVDRAMALASGTPLSVHPLPPTTTEEIQRLESEEIALQDGLAAANQATEKLATTIARDFGRKSQAAHAASVKTILDCLRALDAANQSEEKIRLDLEKLGYHSHGLPNKSFTWVGGVDDANGSAAYYFTKDALAYIAI